MRTRRDLLRRDGRSLASETMTDATDEDLMMRIGTGDRVAFGELVRRHLNRAVAVAQRVTGSRSDAEEIAQEAFLRVWTKAPHWRGGEGEFRGARFTTWLYRVVVNLGIDRRRRPAMSALEAAGDPADPADSALHSLEKAQLSGRVADAVATLPERQRAALTLCFYEGLSNREAADILALSPGAVESLLVRARRSLREALAGVAAEFLEVSP
ncbi:MAG TPA: RNA polymerase sigma factor [Candidatus Acidoferrum sp.]|nr:RNA polymerase sigma factor [Candidatus Acidoferrum sp.]